MQAFIGGAKLPLGLDAISFAAAHFLETLKDRIGPKKFNELVARDGSKTLAFAIDTTGSMTDDIRAAKAITKAIIAEERTNRVDFVLSPFADPGWCSLTLQHKLFTVRSSLNRICFSVSIAAYKGGCEGSKSKDELAQQKIKVSEKRRGG